MEMKNDGLLPPMNAAVGEVMNVSVPCNPTTGFICTLSEMPDCISLLNTEYIPSHPGLMGSGGTQVYSFVATQKGEGALLFQEIKLSHPLEFGKQTQMDKRFVIVK